MLKKNFLFGFLMLTLASLACSIFIGGPAYPISQVSDPTPTALDLQTDIQQAVADGAQTGTISLKISESQLTSYLANKLDSETDPLISDPQVILRDGQMIVFGKVQRGIFSANVSITAQAGVDQNGQPKIEIIQTDLGPLPAPKGLNEAVSSFVSEAYTGSLGPIATGFRLDSITIDNGIMTVTGRIK